VGFDLSSSPVLPYRERSGQVRTYPVGEVGIGRDRWASVVLVGVEQRLCWVVLLGSSRAGFEAQMTVVDQSARRVSDVAALEPDACLLRLLRDLCRVQARLSGDSVEYGFV
jgi:hypothetical protein